MTEIIGLLGQRLLKETAYRASSFSSCEQRLKSKEQMAKNKGKEESEGEETEAEGEGNDS